MTQRQSQGLFEKTAIKIAFIITGRPAKEKSLRQKAGGGSLLKKKSRTGEENGLQKIWRGYLRYKTARAS
ncbi:MAG: hypothetical protein LKJ90_09680 [Faecalibacterium sp.]|nr:hypothetical protein [Faecalibacterium sp.]